MNARDSILQRLRAAPLSAEQSLPDVMGWYVSYRRIEDSAQKITRLRSAMQAARTEIHDTTSSAWPELLLQLAAAKNLRKLLIGKNTPHGATLTAHDPAPLQLVPYEQPIESWRDTLFDEVDASLTLARSAIAETGSLVLWPSEAEPRLMSLVPPVHFVLLDVSTIHTDLDTAMRAENWKDGMPSNALLISGPSKTADIQQTLAYGAHGPRELVLLLCHPEQNGVPT